MLPTAESELNRRGKLETKPGDYDIWRLEVWLIARTEVRTSNVSNGNGLLSVAVRNCSCAYFGVSIKLPERDSWESVSIQD